MKNLVRSAAVVLCASLALAMGACTAQRADEALPAASATAPSPSTEPTTPTATDASDPQDPGSWVVAEDSVGPVTLGDALPDAAGSMPEGTSIDDERCDWSAWWTSQEPVYSVAVARPGDADAGIDLIAATTLRGTPGSFGPRTAEGIGIGSTRDDVMAAYPSAMQMDATIGGGQHLKVGDTLFFTFEEGSSTVGAVTVTTRPEPPYEICG